MWLCVTASSLSLPYTDQGEGASHHFLEASMILVAPLPAQGTVFLHQLLDVLFVCTHHSQFHIELEYNVELCGSSPTSFSKYFKDARDAVLEHLQTPA